MEYQCQRVGYYKEGVLLHIFYFCMFFIKYCLKARDLREADCVRLVPQSHRGKGEIVKLNKRDENDPLSYSFSYQRDTYIVSSILPVKFTRLPYPSSSRPSISSFLKPNGLSSSQLTTLTMLFGRNEFDIPIPSFSELFVEHATAPFFVFQVFCVALWCLDEYWFYSLFTLFMLIIFECTVVWQASFSVRLRLRNKTDRWIQYSA
jgi:cation-transporting ATPase 13A1